MKYNLLHVIFAGMILAILSSACISKHREESPPPHKNITEETLIRTNRYLVEKDEERIRQFIKRHGWDMQKTGTGLWYQVYLHGRGEKITDRKWVTINYSVHLLDGTLCYSSEESGPKTFKTGHGGVESGLEQGILMLRKGDKARFILPPNLAYGIPGDHNKIPPRSVIVYDVGIIDVR